MIEEENQPDNISTPGVADESATTSEAPATSTTNEVNLNVAPTENSPYVPGDVAAGFPTNSDVVLGGSTESNDSSVEGTGSATAETPAVEELRRQVEGLVAQLAQRSNENEDLKRQYMRMGADFDNFRKRTSKEKEELENQVKRATISELLSVVDNFERARSQIKPQTDGEMSIHKSYQSVYKQLVDSLKRIGVSPMRPEGKEFDPNLHEAVMRQPTDSHPEGTVIEELVRGYYLGERVLRHAMVKVAAPMESQAPDSSSDTDTRVG